MSHIKVFGHKAPDTDATCSAIIWAHYLNSLEGVEAKPYVLGPLNTETQFVLDHFGFETPELLETLDENDRVVIVDTNNAEELPDGLEQAEILEIIDHHRLLANIKTSYPLEFTVRVLGSTASVISHLLGPQTEELPNDIKGLMLACVLSDTLEFRSPTTTGFDKALAQNLAEDIKADVPELTRKMFEAKSDISSFSDEALLKLDSKKHEQGGKKMRVAVIETTNPKSVLDRKDAIVEAMDKVCADEDLDFVLFFIIDILNEEATLFIPNETVKTIAENTFEISVSGDSFVLPGVVSRKKQIMPQLKV